MKNIFIYLFIVALTILLCVVCSPYLFSFLIFHIMLLFSFYIFFLFSGMKERNKGRKKQNEVEIKFSICKLF